MSWAVFAKASEIMNYFKNNLSPTRAGKIDNLDTTVSSRAPSTTVNTINTNVGSNADASSATGSVHAKLKDVKNSLMSSSARFFTSNGSMVIPANVNQVFVSACAAGGVPLAGDYVLKKPYSVTPGQTLTVVTGSGNTVLSGAISLTLVAASVSDNAENTIMGYTLGLGGHAGGKGGDSATDYASYRSYGGAGGQAGFGGAFGIGGNGGGGGGGAGGYSTNVGRCFAGAGGASATGNGGNPPQGSGVTVGSTLTPSVGGVASPLKYVPKLGFFNGVSNKSQDGQPGGATGNQIATALENVGGNGAPATNGVGFGAGGGAAGTNGGQLRALGGFANDRYANGGIGGAAGQGAPGMVLIEW